MENVIQDVNIRKNIQNSMTLLNEVLNGNFQDFTDKVEIQHMQRVSEVMLQNDKEPEEH